MVNAKLFYGNTERRGFSEVKFTGENRAMEALTSLENIITMNKYEKQSVKIDCYKNIKQKKLAQIKEYEAKAKQLKEIKHLIFNPEKYAEYKSLEKQVKTLKKENLKIDEKINLLASDMVYSVNEKKEMQKELLLQMGFCNNSILYNEDMTTEIESYECAISDEEVYEKSTKMFCDLRKKLDSEIEIIKNSFKFDEKEMLK